jgi:Domain of unknown function (DUF4386)
VDTRELVGGTLVAGLVIFMVGAVVWRLAYEQPLPAALRVIHADRRRRAWIHVWMISALLVTPAGVAGVAAVVERPVAVAPAVMAAQVYGLGAVCWIASLAFRLTVVPWAAERTVADGDTPQGFAALDAWASALYIVHMAASFVAFALLGTALLASGAAPRWLGWLGVAWGVAFLAGFVATRFAGPFNPPFWAHTYTGVVGIVLLTS